MPNCTAMKRNLRVAMWALAACLLLAAQELRQRPAPAQFSAEMNEEPGGQNAGMRGKIYVDGGRVRMDMTRFGKKASLIVLPEKKVRYLIWHADKTYWAVSTEQTVAAIPEPAPTPNPCAAH